MFDPLVALIVRGDEPPVRIVVGLAGDGIYWEAGDDLHEAVWSA